MFPVGAAGDCWELWAGVADDVAAAFRSFTQCVTHCPRERKMVGGEAEGVSREQETRRKAEQAREGGRA